MLFCLYCSIERPANSTPAAAPGSDWSSLLFSTNWFGELQSAVEESPQQQNSSTCEPATFWCPNLRDQFQVENKYLVVVVLMLLFK